MKLNGKVAVVTGGSRDIGRAVSVKLAAEGAKVVINYLNNEAQANETLAEIRQAGGEAVIVKADVTKTTEVAVLIAEAQKAFGQDIHILVNVTGGLVARKLLADMDADFWDHVMALNVRSAFLATQQVAPYMPAGGAIINFSSQAGRDGGGFGASAYATSKAAVATFTKAMAKELGPKGIRVNAVDPGMIATSFHDTFTKPEIRVNVANATPLRREGKASEVADLVAYLASDESSFITGTNIDINGGTWFS
ncbi:SDR family NAD(P)-dependent oxidoreductase [Sediminibacterium ginsengisoli]|uniref:3-oxoacyl-[acyl-carrier protein] reductase n=1 Tax=Sediminibacterium ginsengisoli TaxID=413434 RepID=A0A1T4PAA9_9BACT|nr:3-oxoacyl-ACP reductase family protein [Sediminibacterium ginsengisoli]SJZ88176.1 3-oxoacyl-[acyl-carrier protein] reductase [Sediminibacterium ginsengisoli]